MKTEKLIKIIDLILVLTVIIAGACLFIGLPYYAKSIFGIPYYTKKSILSIYIFIFNIIILCFIVIIDRIFENKFFLDDNYL
jgi:hypothetical protein